MAGGEGVPPKIVGYDSQGNGAKDLRMREEGEGFVLNDQGTGDS